ncbi:MAG: hypothetical protein QOH90_44 [Actinomycetota bacterium]|nr:hypothetical protein [Actinomycetota bacterium]
MWLESPGGPPFGPLGWAPLAPGEPASPTGMVVVVAMVVSGDGEAVVVATVVSGAVEAVAVDRAGPLGVESALG